MAIYTSNSNYHTHGSCLSNNYHNSERQWQPRRSQIHWEAGQLAFLTSCENYINEDYHSLIESKEIPPKATNHPCVILQRFQDSDHCLITPVSAFSASEETNFLPPWKQMYHQSKKAQDFRSFRGSESSSSTSSTSRSTSSNSQFTQLLELRDGRTMPKPKASWIFIQHIYVVPVHLLIPFRKPGKDWEPREPRQLTDNSLAALRTHIQQKCTVFKQRIDKLNQFRHRSQSASSGCSRPDQPQQCFSSAYQIQATSKPAANATANAIATPPKIMSSTTSRPTQGPWRKLQPAPAHAPATPKSTPTILTKKRPNQLQKTLKLLHTVKV